MAESNGFSSTGVAAVVVVVVVVVVDDVPVNLSVLFVANGRAPLL